MTAIRIGKGQREIRSVEDWFEVAPPAKGEKQWVDKRSAKELAKAWFPVPGQPQVPAELDALLASSPSLGRVTLTKAEPEAHVYFDDLRGNPRQCDLLVEGKCALGPIVVSVEAKADEAFGKLAGEELANCERLAREGRDQEAATRSHVPERIDRLASALFGTDRSAVLGIRYQLLYGVAAALSAASQAKGAAFVVHEFLSDATSERKQHQNQADLDRFMALLTKGAVSSLTSGALVGPFSVPGNDHIARVPLFVGKAVRQL
jgi:hypothetical protein